MKITGFYKYSIFILIISSVIAVILDMFILYNGLLIVLPILIFYLYYVSSIHLDYRVFFIGAVMYFGRLAGHFFDYHGLMVQLLSFGTAYCTLLYFSYQNSKSFNYSSRDVFTIVMATFFYTVIFFITLYELFGIMGGLRVPVCITILLLYVLLIAAGMHYVNIRSERSMWFFLVVLSFTISDFSLILDLFYVTAKELQVLITIYHPLALFFLIKYINSDSTILKSKNLQNF